MCTVHLTVCPCDATYAFQSDSTLYSYLARNKREIWSLGECNCTGTHENLIRKRRVNYLGKLAKWLNWVVATYLYGTLTVFSFHVTYAFQGESTLDSCLNVKELFAQNKG